MILLFTSDYFSRPLEQNQFCCSLGKRRFAAKQVRESLPPPAKPAMGRWPSRNHIVFLVRIKLAQRRDRHERNIVFRIRAAGNSLTALLHRADDGEELAVDGDLFSNGGGLACRKKRLQRCCSRGRRRCAMLASVSLNMRTLSNLMSKISPIDG